MREIILTFTLLIFVIITQANMTYIPYSKTINPGDKIFLEFKDIEGEVNVNGTDGCEMLRSYIVGKTTLEVVSSKEESDFIFMLSVIEKNMGYRKGKIDILDSKTDKVIFESKWKKGNSNAAYGFSGTRHAIGRIVKGQILKKFKEIKK
tara:strand:+ start:2978 stop:3424 length:447 start_codon:yes stop_codon:yes gene_type:complete